MSESIKKRTLEGVGWSALDNVLSYLVTFGVGIVLARLLSPEDYGLIGLTGVFVALCGCFINAGFDRALIRKKGATDEDYNTVFIINLCTSIVLYGITFVFTPYIADFFERQELVALMRVVALGMILNALSIVPKTRLTKQLKFKVQTQITFIAGVVRSVVGIYTALIGFGVWALVIQSLIGNALTVLLLFWADRWFPVFRFSKKSFKELFGFGSKLLASSILATIWSQSFQVIIGKCYSPATLGQYARANSFSDIFSSNLTGVVQRVSYPVLSEIQDDHKRLREGYRRIIKMTMFFSFCCMFMLAAIARPMIIFLIGEKWLQAAVFLQIICFSHVFYPLQAINLNMLQVQGRSDLFLKLEIIKKIIATGPLLIGVFVSIYWMLISGVFVGFIAYYLNSYYSGIYLNYGIVQQVRDILPSFVVAMAGALAAFIVPIFAKTFVDTSGWMANSIILLLQLSVGVSVMYVLCEYFNNKEYQEIKKIACKIYSGIHFFL